MKFLGHQVCILFEFFGNSYSTVSQKRLQRVVIKDIKSPASTNRKESTCMPQPQTRYLAPCCLSASSGCWRYVRAMWPAGGWSPRGWWRWCYLCTCSSATAWHCHSLCKEKSRQELWERRSKRGNLHKPRKWSFHRIKIRDLLSERLAETEILWFLGDHKVVKRVKEKWFLLEVQLN